MTTQVQCIYEFGSFRLDTPKRLLLREGEVVSLTPKCFDILVALVETRGGVIEKDELMKRVWADSFVEEGNLTYNISILRKALGERAGEHRYIATIPGHGYQFVANVSELRDGTAENEGDASSVREATRTSLADESFMSRVVRGKRKVVIVAAVMALAVAGMGLYNFISGKKSQAGPAVPFQKMKISRLTSTGRASVAAISPDGKYVAHATGGRSQLSLWLRHIPTGSDKEIVPTAGVDYTSVTFSPDGNYIYFLRTETAEGRNPLYRAPVLGDSIHKLVSDVDAGPTFSPDGRRIAYVRGYPERDEAVFFTADADGAHEQALFAKRPLLDVFPPGRRAWTAWGPAWSPDGAVIAFALRKDQPDGKYWNVMTFRLKDRAEQPITFQKWSSLGQLAWLSDGSGLILAASDNESYPAEQVWHVAYPSGEVRRITNDTSDYNGIRLTADSAVLVTVRTDQSSNVWISPDGYASRAAQITFNNVEGGNGLSWTPDGRIVYTTRARGFSNIWIMDADGSGQNQLTVDAGENFSPSVSPDGRYIVFASDRTGDRCVWRMDNDGGNPKQLSYGIDTGKVEVTPDGKWVIYVDSGSASHTLWKVSIDGGPQVQLTDYYSQSPAVSPDGKQMVFVFLDEKATPKRFRVAIIPFGGGPPAKVFDLPQPVGQKVRWTLDGRALTYLDTLNGVYNIWAMPLDGGPPKQLTNFTTDQIFAYAWSRDGKQLTCARGNQNSDVVLISAFSNAVR